MNPPQLTKFQKIVIILEKNGFSRYYNDSAFWISANKEYFVIANLKTATLTKVLDNKFEYVILEEGIAPSNLNKILKEYEVKDV